MYALPAPLYTLYSPIPITSAILVNSNGSITTIKPESIDFTIQLTSDKGYAQNILIQTKNESSRVQFQLTLSTAETNSSNSDFDSLPFDSTPVLGFRHQAGRVTGIWNGSAIDGYGFIQCPSDLKPETKAIMILDSVYNKSHSRAETIRDFKGWSDQTNFFSSEATLNDVTNSWLVWAIPIIIISLLLISCLYLIWVRKKQNKYPWMRSVYMPRKTLV